MPYTNVSAQYHLLRMKELGRVYWCNTFATMGSSLVVIFVPIYLLKLGYSFQSVLIYLLLQQVFAGLTQYPASKLFGHLHPHHIFAIGTVVYAAFFGMLATLSSAHWPLTLLAFVWAINRSTYWAALHYIFSSSRAHKTAGVQIAGLQALAVFASTIAPAIGGIVATLFGINYSYIVATTLLLVAALPMFSTFGEPKRSHIYLPWHHFLAMRRDALANGFNGIILVAELSLWPLLIYTFISSYAGIGLLSSVIAISAICVTMYVGHRQKKHREHRYIKAGIATYSLTSIGRALAQTAGQVFGLNLLAGIGRSLYVTPYMNRYYTNSDGPHRLGYITVMETSFAIGSALFIVLLICLSQLLSFRGVLEAGLAVVAFCTLGVRLIR